MKKLGRLKTSNYNQDTINIVMKFLNDKIAKAKAPESNEVSAIGYDEIAEMYNVRLEQYKKNPFYEYDYIVVPNKSDGSTSKEHIQEIIVSHAMQGWRLVTMYSNEIGKNSVSVGGVGSNITICEDVLVFERCIKGGE